VLSPNPGISQWTRRGSRESLTRRRGPWHSQRRRAAPRKAAAPGKDAGVAQWQSRSFPSLRRGFDSLHPLQPAIPAQQSPAGPEAAQMPAFFLTLLATAIASAGARDQTLVARLAATLGPSRVL